MLYLDSIFIGASRIVGFCCIIFLIKFLVSVKNQSQFGFDYFIPRLVTFLSAIIIIGFLLTQLNAYDSFISLTIILGFMFFLFLNLKKNKNKRKTPNKHREELSKTHINWQIGLGLLIAFLGFISRFYFYRFDRYALSDIWYRDLSNMKELAYQKWFFLPSTMTGEFLLINFYGTITGLSDSMALESFGLIEVATLALVIFWVTYRSFKRLFFPALTTSLFFTFYYMFLPINIDLTTMHKSVFLSLIIALPIILFVHSPKILNAKISTFFRWMIYLCTATFLIDSFVSIYILFPVILLSFLLKYKDVYVRKSFYAYLISAVFIFIIHYIASLVLGQDFFSFIASNIFSYNTYTYTPQLILPLEQLLLYYLYLSLGLTLLSLFFAIKSIKDWSLILILITQIDLLLLAAVFEVDFLDLDLLNQVLSVFIPILIGIFLYYVNLLFKAIVKLKKEFVFLKLVLSFTLIGLVLYSLYDTTMDKIPFNKEIKNEQILAAYDKIENRLLPFSFGVVNHGENQVISTGNHFFLTYEYFNTEYIKQDQDYFKHKDDPIYLHKNPAVVLPNSIFVFSYKNEENSAQLENTLAILKQRGRKIHTFYSNSLLNVYEIINEPEKTHVKDLLF
ncbi:hypothetical protein RBU60_12620 [Mesonia sp. MT50]|uniref:Glycosyltransferase RgtA/B/C/D-like domain-containing protein n=1 Tax=Mesonia profundi TaxID=3070998 RepID=A0ABU1A667_9FLAO|nr:hypothetical protein [Mesonia profundi]MDQ7918416.1 hypothetical protein [Mesonia profundi]